MADKYIYVKLVKAWSRFNPGDVIRFGRSKGLGRIEAGEGVEVPKQEAVNGPSKEDIAKAAKKSKKPIVENAKIEPKAERAVATPEAPPFAKVEVKAASKKSKKKGG